jgi:CDP-diacylglycerol---serine O-phosphatidyltransferase
MLARTLWSRRTTLRQRMVDNPRPPGGQRWTGRLRRRGGVLARRVLRVRHRRTSALTVERAPTRTQIVRAPAAEPVAAGSLLPGARTPARQLRFALVTSCTLASLSLGVLAIQLAMNGDVRVAAACLIGCVACDGLDGALARRLGVASPFGAQMDSLADMCAFGIAAPVVIYASVSGSVPTPAAAIGCALVAACAAIRLARFNISPKDGRFFTGFPTTTTAAVIAIAVLIELPLPPTALLLGVAALAFAMVSSFPYATLARLLRLPPWLWLAPLAGALVDARLTFVALVGAYLASGPLLWFHSRTTRRDLTARDLTARDLTASGRSG